MEQQPEAQKTGTAGTGASSDLASRERVALAQGLGGILGVKAGMTQVYSENGDSIAVTVIDLKPTIITQVKTKENNGYQGIQVGFLEKKAKSSNRAEKGHAKACGTTGFYHYQEFRLSGSASLDGLAVGKVLSPEFVKAGDCVDLTAVSKGKGFQGGMKRYHMAGGYKTHGASLSHRQLGSIGNRADPAKCFKNKKMAGQMGNERVTVQNVKVIRVDMENQLLLVHGSVPGPKSGIVTIRRTVKNAG
ncbi:50S ribosomal protein L3 [bacterium]|jgi:large subunit ribosomal protein L3|nr:50S ribosomal protein L3 [bacterium]